MYHWHDCIVNKKATLRRKIMFIFRIFQISHRRSESHLQMVSILIIIASRNEKLIRFTKILFAFAVAVAPGSRIQSHFRKSIFLKTQVTRAGDNSYGDVIIHRTDTKPSASSDYKYTRTCWDYRMWTIQMSWSRYTCITLSHACFCCLDNSNFHFWANQSWNPPIFVYHCLQIKITNFVPNLNIIYYYIHLFQAITDLTANPLQKRGKNRRFRGNLKH